MVGAKWAGSVNNCLKFTNNNTANDYLANFTLAYDKWINLTFTLDGSIGTIYVDGLPVVSEDIKYKNSMFWENIGAFAFGRTQFWGDAPMTGKIDNINIYATAMTEKEIMTQQGIITVEDDTQAVTEEKDKFELNWDGNTASIDFPKYAGEGVRLEYSSSNKEVITDSGEVLFPKTSEEVTITVTFKRGNVTLTKDYVITVEPITVDVSIFDAAALDQANYTSGSYYKELMTANLDFMMSLDKDRLLYNYRRIAGLDTKGASSYGAWISETSNGAGQFEAHYVIALAKASQTMPEYSYKGETVLDRLTYMMNALKECQDAYALLDSDNAGYLSAISVENFDALEEGRTRLSDGTSIWVPWYFMHKNLEALNDVYLYANDSELSQTAKTMMTKLADWTYKRMSSVTETQRLNILKTEYGGMAEVLFQIFSVTKDNNHYKDAKFFEEKSLLDNIHNNIDVLSGLHANTAIPKFLGAAAAYEVTGDDYYKTIVVNAYEMIMTRIYATGGTGKDEFFEEEGHTHEANGAEETCCSYNMLKMADYLFRWTGEKKYADYYEKTFLNHILASMAPDTGLKTYFVNTAFGYYKIYHTADASFWCCSCTGMALMGVVFCQIGNLFACCSDIESFSKSFNSRNKWIYIGIAFEILIALAIVYIPFLQGFFNTTGLTLLSLSVLLICPLIILAAEEFRKFLVRKKGTKSK